MARRYTADPGHHAGAPVRPDGVRGAAEPVAAGCGAVIVEDAAQSQGATRHGRSPARWDSVAGTSFYPGKNLGAAGDAGAVVTDDDDVAARVRMLGAHGSSASTSTTRSA